MKEYLKSLFAALIYAVIVISAAVLFIMMSGNFLRVLMGGLVVFIILPSIYYFVEWLFSNED